MNRAARFVSNVFWNWLGVGAGLFSGLLLSPYLIRKIGPEGYGVWALSFALVEYYWFADFGFRSATVKYVAHFWALNERAKVSEVVNTGVAYAAAAAVLVFMAVIAGAHLLGRFFHISPAYRSSFFTLLLLISGSWCLGIVFSLFGAALEALQRFDSYNRVLVTVTAMRAFGTALLLYLGYGLVAIGALVVASQLLGYLLYYRFFRRVFPEFRMDFRQARVATLRLMGRYGVHNFLGNVSQQVLNGAPAMLIGHFLPTAMVGFYNLPVRLLQYSSEAVGRIGIVTNSNTAELTARGETKSLSHLAVFTNRYCLTLFAPLAIVLFTHGTAFFRLWIPSAAKYAAPLLPILLAAYLAGFVGQFSSSMLLLGMARYGAYSRGLAVEAGLCIAGLTYALPRLGLIGAAWVVAGLMIANRGLYLPYLLSRAVERSFFGLLAAIHLRPLLTAIPVTLVSIWFSRTFLPGRNFAQLAAVAAIDAALYYSLAWWTCLPAAHRAVLGGWFGAKLPRVSALRRRMFGEFGEPVESAVDVQLRS